VSKCGFRTYKERGEWVELRFILSATSCLPHVTIGLWADAGNFQEQVAQYFNDDKPLLSFEKYRRRRVIFEPVGWRVGETPLPSGDSPGVQ
jgi:hypothetical protein